MLRLIVTPTYSELTNRKLIIFSESHHGFQLPFYQIFTPMNDILFPSEKYEKLVNEYVLTPVFRPKFLKDTTLRYVGSKNL